MPFFETYDFGYSWPVTYGHLIPLALAIALIVVARGRRWRPWTMVLPIVIAVWAVSGLALSLMLTRPVTLPTERFLASGTGRVLDAGAGSGRAAVGVLLARPGTTVVGLDIYEGYWGIEGNTPERFLENARRAGAGARAEAQRGDVREMPFDDASFDAVISSYAIDHLRRDGIVQALDEVARVLKPGGEFLLMIVHVDWPVLILSPHALGHHPRQDPARWRALLEDAGFVLEEDGTRTGTLFFLARKHAPDAGSVRRVPRDQRAGSRGLM